MTQTFRFLLAVLAFSALSASAATSSYDLRNLHVQPRDAENRTIQVTFNARELTFSLNLDLNQRIWGKDAKIITDGEKMNLFLRSYSGTALVSLFKSSVNLTGLCAATFSSNFKKFQATIQTDQDVFEVLYSPGTRPMDSKLRVLVNPQSTQRRLQQSTGLVGCFENEVPKHRTVQVGFIADPSYYARVTGQTEDIVYSPANDMGVLESIISMLNTMNVFIYNRELNVTVALGTVIIGAAANKLDLTKGSVATGSSHSCTLPPIGHQLERFRNWRYNHHVHHGDKNGLWHYITDCYSSPDAAGLAYIGQVCHQSYGVAISSVTEIPWTTVAREIGHNLGADYSGEAGSGIVEYGIHAGQCDNCVLNPKRKNEICYEIKSSLSHQPGTFEIPNWHCWTITHIAEPLSTYSWVLSDEETLCLPHPHCGHNSFRSKLYKCERQTILHGVTTTEIVHDRDCDEFMKPDPVTTLCDYVPCPDVCGDGVITGDEVCDGDDCCNDDCMGYNNTGSCAVVDAALVYCKHTGCTLTQFQGVFAQIFALNSRGEKDPPQPNSIQTSWMVTKSLGHVTAATATSAGDLMWFFHDLQVVSVYHGQTHNGVEIIGQDWHVPADFVACGSVTAASLHYSQQGGEWILLVCHKIYTWFNIWKKTSASTHSWPITGLFSIPSNEIITAIFQNPVTGGYTLITGNKQWNFVAGRLGSTSVATLVNEIDVPSCVNPNCMSCSNSTCTKCARGFRVHVDRCIESNVLIKMDFVKDSRHDMMFTVDGQPVGGLFVGNHAGVESSALQFTPTKTLELKTFPEWATRKISHFKISMFFKPNIGSSQILLSVGEELRVRLTPSSSPDLSGIEFTFKGQSFATFDLEFPVFRHKWNFMSLTWRGGVLETFNNGAWKRIVAFDSQAKSVLSSGLSFGNIQLGDFDNGFDGAMGSFEIVDIGSAPASVDGPTKEEKLPDWAIGLIVSSCLVVAAGVVVGIFLHRKWGSNVAFEPVTMERVADELE